MTYSMYTPTIITNSKLTKTSEILLYADNMISHRKIICLFKKK